MIILLCLSLSLVIFFSVYYLVSNIEKIEIAGKIKNAVEKRNSGNFIITYILIISEKLGNSITHIKYKKFTSYIEGNGTILKSLGEKYKNINPYQFFAIQILVMFIGMLFVALFLSLQLMIVLSVGVLFFFLPVLKIKEELKKRKESILKQLPEMVDLFSIMLAVGLDFYGAAEKIVLIVSGPLVDELKDALVKISLGYDKNKALCEMAEKTCVEQVSDFVRIINMALDSGTEMSGTLKRMAVSIRNERFLQAEKKAHEAPVKMLLPLVLLIFPTIFLVIFGPIAINFMKNGF